MAYLDSLDASNKDVEVTGWFLEEERCAVFHRKGIPYSAAASDTGNVYRIRNLYRR
jgi:hypothetical protein